MVKNINVFVLVAAFSIASFAFADPVTVESMVSPPTGFLDKELAKDAAAQPDKAVSAQSNQPRAKRPVKEYKSGREVLKKEDKKKSTNLQDKTLAPLNMPSSLEDSANSSTYNPDDWVPKTVKSDKSKKLLEQYERQEEELVNKLVKLNYDTNVPPKELYESARTEENKHLPPVYTRSDYFALAFDAVKKDDENALRAALSNSKYLNQQNNTGDTLLIFAVQNGSLNSARVLLAKGALTDVVNNRNRTALHYAASLGDEDAARLLLSMGASTNIIDDMDMTALDYAVLEKQDNIAKMINSYMGLE